MADRCDLSDLLVDQCACRLHRPATDDGADDTAPSSAFTAQFPGFCRHCHDAIEVGDEITRTSSGYQHQGCAE